MRAPLARKQSSSFVGKLRELSRGKRKARQRRDTKKDKHTSLLPWIVVLLGIIVVGALVWSWAYPRLEPLNGTEIASVGIVDQFYSQRPSFTDSLVEFLEDQRATYEVHKDAEVTVEFYRELPTFGYKLIVLRVHAGVSTDEEEKTALFTSEEYNPWEYIPQQLQDQVGEGVFWAEEASVFTITPRFVTDCMQGDFQDATIVLSSCWGLHNTLLAESFVDRGALSFIGWDERVELGHTDEAILALLNYLIDDGQTIEEAVDRVMDEVGADPAYGCVLRYHSHGDARVSL